LQLLEANVSFNPHFEFEANPDVRDMASWLALKSNVNGDNLIVMMISQLCLLSKIVLDKHRTCSSYKIRLYGNACVMGML